MRQKRKSVFAGTQQHTMPLELCTCVPLSMLQGIAPADGQMEIDGADQIVPTTHALNKRVQAMLDELFPRRGPLSIFMLHVVQVESTQLSASHKRRRYHAPPGLLEQIMVQVRRVLRADDQVLQHEHVGAAIVLPNVDQQGAHTILERIYRAISLLQAETVVPPLTRETTITLGIGSYPEPGTSRESLLYYVGQVARRFTWRPAITAELLAIKPVPGKEIVYHNNGEKSIGKYNGTVPFMDLPKSLPRRLTNLIPYTLALKLGCAPVGRDQHCLTVAMLHPLNRESLHLLEQVTGLHIFPVSCNTEDLKALLQQEW